MTAINALTPRGATDIRDAFFRSRDQDRVAADSRGRPGVLLLTDGVHNFRFGSSRLEAPPDLLERGIRVYALGVGTRPTSTWPRSTRWRPARAGRPTR